MNEELKKKNTTERRYYFVMKIIKLCILLFGRVFFFFPHSSRDKCFNREYSFNVVAPRLEYSARQLRVQHSVRYAIIPHKDIIFIINSTMEIATFILKK